MPTAVAPTRTILSFRASAGRRAVQEGGGGIGGDQAPGPQVIDEHAAVAVHGDRLPTQADFIHPPAGQGDGHGGPPLVVGQGHQGHGGKEVGAVHDGHGKPAHRAVGIGNHVEIAVAGGGLGDLREIAFDPGGADQGDLGRFGVQQAHHVIGGGLEERRRP